MLNSVHERLATLGALASQGRLNSAIEEIVTLAKEVMADESTHGRIFGSGEIDALLIKFGEQPESAPQPRSGGVVVIATALYEAGGHTRVLRDTLMQPSLGAATVLLTGLDHDQTVEGIAQLLPNGVACEIAPSVSLAERVRWLQDRLSALAPSQTFLFQHGYDAVAVAAVQPNLVGRLYFYHHVDHLFSLGVHIPHAVHVDPHRKGFHHCREDEQLANNVYWPLTGGVGELPVRSRQRGSQITTCCAGGREKFEAATERPALPYQINYAEVVAQTIATTNGRHVHIGPLSERLLLSIGDLLDQLGLSRDRFVHLRFVPDLAQALIEHGVDVYMGSIRRGGGRALVEAMSAGLPMLLHDNYRTIFFSDVPDAYAGVKSWRTLEQLRISLQSLTPEVLDQDGRSARLHYEANHSRAIFAAAVKASLSDLPCDAPPIRVHRADLLQNFYDDKGLQRATADAPFGLTVIDYIWQCPPGSSLCHIDKISVASDRLSVSGWVLGRPAASAVEIWADGVYIGEATPSVMRRDVLEAYPHYDDQAAGFSITAETLADRAWPSVLDVTVRASANTIGSGRFLLDTPAAKRADKKRLIAALLLASSDADAIAPPAIPDSIELRQITGRWDILEHDASLINIEGVRVGLGEMTVAGWALGRPNVSLVTIAFNDEPAVEFVTDIARPDVLAAYPSYGEANAGFHIAFPISDDPLRLCKLVVTLRSSDRALGTGLFDFAPRELAMPEPQAAAFSASSWKDEKIKAPAVVSIPLRQVETLWYSKGDAAARMNIEAATLTATGALTILGWTVALEAISHVTVSCNGGKAASGSPVIARRDVLLAHPGYNEPHAGFSLVCQVDDVSAGIYTLDVTVRSQDDRFLASGRFVFEALVDPDDVTT